MTKLSATEFFEKAWKSYVELTPDAPLIHALLERRGEHLVNDHVAFRTFNLPGMTRLELGSLFEQWGYVRAHEELDFPEKKLKANYYLHSDEKLPKVFISELLTEKVSPELRQWILDTTKSAQGKTFTLESFLKPTWSAPSSEDYRKFYSESEYAAWTLAFGIRVNHFTVLVNSLKTLHSLEELNELLIQNHFQLNQAGGQIKGTPTEFLEQSSTVAKRVPYRFSDGITDQIMGCYYEFARRYPLPGKETLFQGFIPKSADKIFESTFERSSLSQAG